MNSKTLIPIIATFVSLAIGIIIVFFINHAEKERFSDTPVTEISTKVDQEPSRAIRSESAPQSPPTDNKRLYKGYWFDIEYPKIFTPSPTEPVNYHEGVRMILTDQAFFKSPEGDVEFFVYSPLWAGYPEYLDMLSTEELVSEETTERDVTSGGAQLKRKNRVTFKTYREKNGLYFRSIALYENSIYEGQDFPETSHVFGVKYKNQESYNIYKQAYTDFKDSLQQYSD